MISSGDIKRDLITFTKDIVADQDYLDIHSTDSGFALDATKGLGTAANDTAVVIFSPGGFDNQRITAVVRRESTTSQAQCDVGLLIRYKTNVGSDDRYYWLRFDGSFFKITRVLNSTSFSTLTSRAYNMPADTDVTVVFQVIGDELLGSYDDGTNTGEISVTDSNIPSGGNCGFRTSSSSGWIKSVTIEELPAAA